MAGGEEAAGPVASVEKLTYDGPNLSDCICFDAVVKESSHRVGRIRRKLFQYKLPVCSQVARRVGAPKGVVLQVPIGQSA